MMSDTIWQLIATAGLALLGKLVMDISELNKNIAVVVVRVDSHERRFDSNEQRIERLESKKEY